METPNNAQLNFRNLDWLEIEANKWFGIYANAFGKDKADAKKYLDQVLAEKAQRAKQMLDPIKRYTWMLEAPFEAVGGSAGEGASGAAAGIVETSKEVGDVFAGGAEKVLVAATLVALVVGGIWAYGGRKRASA